MPFDGTGNFNRVHDWTDDRDASIKILAARFDAENDDFAAGLEACLNRNGENAATADISMGGYKLTNLADPAAAQDAATKAYVDAAGFLSSGDEILWRGSSAPTGFTVQSIDNKAVKIVSGAPGADGGSNSFSSVFNSSVNSGGGGAHTPSGTVSVTLNKLNSAVFGSGTNVVNTASASFSGNAVGNHTHATNLNVQFREFNVLQKD